MSEVRIGSAAPAVQAMHPRGISDHKEEGAY